MAYGKIKADTLIYDNSGSDVEVTISSLGAKAGLSSPDFTTDITLKAQAPVKFEDDSGGEFVGLKAPTGVTSYTVTLPATAPSNGQVLKATSATALGWSADTALTLVDEDNFSSNSATSVPSQQSTKAYITATSQPLDADLTALAGCQTGSAAALALLTSTEVAALDGFTGAVADLNYIDVATAGTAEASKAVVLDASKDITGLNDVTISGDLTVNGTTTTINSTTLKVDDKNIELGTVDTPSDSTADGGGITLKGASDKTIVWTNSTDSWDFNQHVNAATGQEFKINNVSVLSATTLGSSVVGSSLTSVGTLAGLDLAGLLTEHVTVTAGKLSTTPNLDLANGNVFLFTTTETTTATPNLRYDGSTTLNSKMGVGDVVTVVLITTAASAGFCAQLTIDGVAVTENWVGGSAPSDGGSSGVDIHSYTIIKTASATWTVIGNQSKTS